VSAWDDLDAFVNNPANGTTLAVLGVAAVVLAAGLVWACWWLGNLPGRRRQVVRPDADGRDVHPPTQLERVERILRDDAAKRDMTCEETLAYFRRSDVHDVFGGDDE
jgi:hypothetical protein